MSEKRPDTREELELLIKSGWQLIALESFEERRALRILGTVAKTCERELICWSVASGLENGSGAGSLDEGLRAMASHAGPALFVVLDAHRVMEDPIAIRRLRDLLSIFAERRQTLVLLGPALELQIELEREAARVELPLPRAKDLKVLFEKLQSGGDPEICDSAVRASLGLTGSEATRIFRKACTSAGSLNDAAVATIVREKRNSLRRTPALTFHDAGQGLDDVGGLGELKRWLRERRRAFGDEAKRFGLPTPRGLLLLGVQGCGKSLCAKAIAREWRFPLLRLDMAATFGGVDRSPEATIREATAIADSLAPVVLWIDEIEKGFAASADDTRARRVFGSFLTWLSEKQSAVFVAATANDIANLPPELLRRGRFDELFFVDLPNLAERCEILSIHLTKRGRDPLQLPIEELAAHAERLSGAELEQVVASALYAAFCRSEDICENDLIDAITQTVPLYDTYEERIKELRDWARHRARPATLDARLADLFSKA